MAFVYVNKTLYYLNINAFKNKIVVKNPWEAFVGFAMNHTTALLTIIRSHLRLFSFILGNVLKILKIFVKEKQFSLEIYKITRHVSIMNAMDHFITLIIT